MDLYSSIPSPSLNFLGTPTSSRLGSSFLRSSFTRKHTPEVLPSLNKPLLTPGREEEKPEGKSGSSHALLPPVPSRRPSLKKVIHNEKPPASHGLPASHKLSYDLAMLNCMNVLCGVGILSTPYAVKEGGWAGLSILLIFAVFSYYTGILLRRCLDSRPGLHTYPDIGQAAFGNLGRVSISITLYAELYASCVDYIILEIDNLPALFPSAHLNIGGIKLNAYHTCAVFTALALLPTVWIRDMSYLSYISAGGVIASILVVGCLYWVGLVEQVDFQTEGTLPTLPVAIGLYGFLYAGFGICSVMYAVAAVMGYIMFGGSAQSQFTLNMPPQLTASNLAVWTTVVNPFTKYAITLSPVALCLEELIPSSIGKPYIFSILLRTTLMLCSLIVGLTIHFFGYVLAFIGSCFTMLVTLILPCAYYIVILGGKISMYQRAMCISVMGLGTVAAVVGTYSAAINIFQELTRT